MAKRNKNFFLEDEIIIFLEKQGNMSAYVNELVRKAMFSGAEAAINEKEPPKIVFCLRCNNKTPLTESCEICGASLAFYTRKKEIPPAPKEKTEPLKDLPEIAGT